MGTVFIHVVKQINFLVLGQGDYLANVFKPAFICDKPAVHFVNLTEQIIKAYLLFNRFLSKPNQQLIYLDLSKLFKVLFLD
jgi:hypothetical protein